MKKILSLFSILAIAFTACNKSNNAAPSTAGVMFVNGCAGTGNVSITAGSTSVPNGTNLAFMNSTGYQNITAGNSSISFVLTSTGLSLNTLTPSFTVSDHYSVFLGGAVNKSFTLVTTDNLTTSSTDAMIRLVNLSPDTLSLTGNAGSVAFATNVTSGTASSFTSITPGTYTIKAGDPSNISSVVSASSQQFSAGNIYTVIYTGTETGTLSSQLSATVINN